MMYFLIWLYCVIGVIVMLILYWVNNQPHTRTLDKVDELIKEYRQNTWYEFLLEYLVVPLAGVIFLIIAFPYLIYMQFNKDEPIVLKTKPFSVKKSDLIQKLSIMEIEEHETITDPLNAVPLKAFGHLHRKWIKFKKNIKTNDEIWLFSSVWEDEWQSKEKRIGYVIVSEGEPKEYFIKDIKRISDSIEFKL